MNKMNTKKKIVHNIEKLSNYIHMEIYKFLFNKDKIKGYNFTINNNGFFYDINQLDNTTTKELNDLINFYMNNEKRLEKKRI